MSNRQRAMRLDPDVDAILAEIGEGQSSASAYVEALVRDAERDWRTALEALHVAGWQGAELLAAMDALNGFSLVDGLGRPASWAAAELWDAQRLNGLCAKWDVSPERWGEHCQRVRDSEAEARALVTVAREFWRMNPRLERVLRREDG